MTPEQVAESIARKMAEKERDDLEQLGRAQTGGCTVDAVRGQWAVIPGWGVKNLFNDIAIELRGTYISDEEMRAFIDRVCRLLNKDMSR